MCRGAIYCAPQGGLQRRRMSKNRVLIEEQFNWYETNLPLMERKKRGHFSTPPMLVEKILDACCYTPDNDLTHVRVLDPACGSGNFLIGAARRFLAFSTRAGLSLKSNFTVQAAMFA